MKESTQSKITEYCKGLLQDRVIDMTNLIKRMPKLYRMSQVDRCYETLCSKLQIGEIP